MVSRDVLRAIGTKQISEFLPYIRMKHLIDSTGELYFSKEELENPEIGQTVQAYNSRITKYDKNQGCELKEYDDYIYLDEYVKNTTDILRKLIEATFSGNDGQYEANQKFVTQIAQDNIDNTKK